MREDRKQSEGRCVVLGVYIVCMWQNKGAKWLPRWPACVGYPAERKELERKGKHNNS